MPLNDSLPDLALAGEVSKAPQRGDFPSVLPTIIGILGVTYNTDNYGVRVLLSGLVQSLVGAVPNPRFRLVDYGPEPFVWPEHVGGVEHDLQLVNLRFSWRLHLPNNIARLLFLAWFSRLLPVPRWRQRLLYGNPWLRQILSARVHLSLAGGDSFSDIYALRRFFYVVLPQILVLALGKPLVLLPQTYGPFKSRTARAVARFIFRRAKFIYSRDAEGLATVAEILGTKDPKVRLSPDVGFLMEPDPADPAVLARMDALRSAGPVVGLNVSSLLFMGGYSRQNMFGLREDYPALMDAVIATLVEELGATVVLVPHVFGDPLSEECEVKLLRRISPQWVSKYPNRIVFFDQLFTHRQIKSVIGRCDLFIGSRMHACIAAGSQGVPTIGLAYSGKFAGVMKAVETGLWVADLRSDDVNATLRIIREAFRRRQEARERLQQALPELKTLARALFQSRDFQSLLDGENAKDQENPRIRRGDGRE